MKTRNPFLSRLVALALVLISATATLAAWPAAHLDLADQYLKDISPANNHYDSPVAIYYDAQGKLHATTKCGSFVGKLLRNAYTNVTSTVLDNLTGSGSPNATQWYDAISDNRSYTNTTGTFTLHGTRLVNAMAEGDILASSYSTASGATGHVMLVDTFEMVATGLWLVRVIDSTEYVHGDDPDYPDTRYASGDEGIGAGFIFLYTDGNHYLTGWTWSADKNSTIYQTTNAAAPNYRPMVIGRMTGPGL